MNLGEIMRTSLSEIRHNKMRSGLTLLGIILGTFALTFMTSFLDGIVAAVWQGFDDLGFDGVMYVVDREARDLREQAIFARSNGLQPSDAVVLMDRRRAVADVAPVMMTEEIVRRGSFEKKARVTGATASYAPVRHRSLELGRFISDLDESSFAKVCVLGHRLRTRLFGTEEPLGQFVMVGGRAFRVIGVGKKLGNNFVNDDEFDEEMEGLTVPLSTLRKFYLGDETPLAFIAVKTAQVEKLGDLKAETTSSLKLAHHGAEDFRVQNIAEEILRFRKGIKEVLFNWQVVLGTIAGISLLVGGIGLLSVLLISIGERLYEIGLRKAIGASDTEIFMQFLSESVVLSVLGGSIGAGIGVVVITLLSGFFPSGLPIHISGLAVSIGIAIVLGVLYGIYPALKASRLAPVEALRSSA